MKREETHALVDAASALRHSSGLVYPRLWLVVRRQRKAAGLPPPSLVTRIMWRSVGRSVPGLVLEQGRPITTYFSPASRVKHHVGLGCELDQPVAVRLLDLDADGAARRRLAEVADALERCLWESALRSPRSQPWPPPLPQPPTHREETLLRLCAVLCVVRKLTSKCHQHPPPT